MTMKAKWRLEEARSWSDLTARKETRRQLREITFIEVEEAIRKKLDWYRTLILATKAIGRSTEPVKDFGLENDREAILARAYFVGAERGMRVGKTAAKRMIKEAHEFASLQLANNAPWLGEVEAKEDD